MPSQFAKRKAKVLSKSVEEPQEVIQQAGDEPEDGLTHTAYDIFLDNDNITHKLVTVKYNPATGDAQIIEIKTIGRLVGLVHENHKKALETLKNY